MTQTLTDVKKFFDSLPFSEMEPDDIYALYQAITYGVNANGYNIVDANNSTENKILECETLNISVLLTPKSTPFLRSLIEEKYVEKQGFADMDSYWSWHREMDKND